MLDTPKRILVQSPRRCVIQRYDGRCVRCIGGWRRRGTQLNVNVYILAPRESAQERSLLGFCATENGRGGIVRFRAEDKQQGTSKNRTQVINEKAAHIVARTHSHSSRFQTYHVHLIR